MAVRILGVSVTPNVVTVGQPINVVVSAEETDWSNLKADFLSWGEVKHSFTNWNKVLNYVYTKPVAGTDCVYSSDNHALFDFDGKQISITGSYTSKYSAEDINDFLGEVFDE